jgi:hypothetical protein
MTDAVFAYICLLAGLAIVGFGFTIQWRRFIANDPDKIFHRKIAAAQDLEMHVGPQCACYKCSIRIPRTINTGLYTPEVCPQCNDYGCRSTR